MSCSNSQVGSSGFHGNDRSAAMICLRPFHVRFLPCTWVELWNGRYKESLDDMVACISLLLLPPKKHTHGPLLAISTGLIESTLVSSQVPKQEDCNMPNLGDCFSFSSVKVAVINWWDTPIAAAAVFTLTSIACLTCHACHSHGTFFSLWNKNTITS